MTWPNLTWPDLAGDHLLQHAAQGGLADGEDAGQGLHRVLHARRPGPEGARHHRKSPWPDLTWQGGGWLVGCTCMYVCPGWLVRGDVTKYWSPSFESYCPQQGDENTSDNLTEPSPTVLLSFFFILNDTHTYIHSSYKLSVYVCLCVFPRCVSLGQGRRVCWSPRTCLPAASTCSKCRSSSTTTCLPIGTLFSHTYIHTYIQTHITISAEKTIFTVSAEVDDSEEKVLHTYIHTCLIYIYSDVMRCMYVCV